MLRDLNDLNADLALAADPRPWVAWHRKCICTNCGTEKLDPAIVMREGRKNHFVRATFSPPAGTPLRSVEAPCYFRWCESCSGERPLVESLKSAIGSAGNDRELAQRTGHILADFFARKRMGGEG